jgi:DNA-binding IscR family transcriptional regulator
MRVVDRALQRLRKEGAIKLITGPRGGWVVA